MPNQDAFAAKRGPQGLVATVSDGLGSRSKSDLGARKACEAAVRVVSDWARGGGFDPHRLPLLIESEWRSQLGDLDPGDCAATCLFVHWPTSGRVTTGSIGDGLVVLQTEDGTLHTHAPREADAFANMTASLGPGPGAWEIRQTAAECCIRRVLLATDGVSDDLDPGALARFLEWLQSEASSLLPWRRRRRLAAHLQNWPTPSHSDDKTVVLLWTR